MQNPIKKEVITFFMELILLKTDVIDLLKRLWIHIILTLSLASQTKTLNGRNFDQDCVLQQIDFFRLWAKLRPNTFPIVTANFLNSLLQKIIKSPAKVRTFGLSPFPYGVSSK